MKKLFVYLLYIIPLRYFNFEKKIISYFSFAFQVLKGSNFKTRTKNRSDINFLRELLNGNQKKRLAVFVAYHEPDSLSQSNLNHLKILKENNFQIMYVHNGLLKNNIKEKLTRFGCFVICRENVGTDIGAYKDSLCLLNHYKLNRNLEWILLCNDSTFCLGGINSEKFISNFEKSLNERNIDFIAQNINFMPTVHYQTYFLCLSRKVFLDKRFIEFWDKYIPLNYRYHAINNGEIKLTTKVLRYFKHKIIFKSYEILGTIANDSKKAQCLLDNLPKTANKLRNYLNSEFDEEIQLILKVKNIISFLENFNPTHTFGPMQVLLQGNPFLKKNLVSNGAFSMVQMYELLKKEGLGIENKLIIEIMDYLTKNGTNNSFISSKRVASAKGIEIYRHLIDIDNNFNLV